MAERFILNYYYVSPQDSKRIEQFSKCSGDSEKTLVTQFVRGWLSKNRDYYLTLSHLDAEARGISFQQWGQIVVGEGMESKSLPDYQQPVNAPPNPLQHVTVASDAIRNRINYISLGMQNLALLRIGIHYDRDSAIGFVSRIVREHLDRNWDKLYAPQVEAEDFNNWK